MHEDFEPDMDPVNEQNDVESEKGRAVFWLLFCIAITSLTLWAVWKIYASLEKMAGFDYELARFGIIFLGFIGAGLSAYCAQSWKKHRGFYCLSILLFLANIFAIITFAFGFFR